MRVFEWLQSAAGYRRHTDQGAAMAEYALLLAGVAMVVAGSAALFGGRLSALYESFF